MQSSNNIAVWKNKLLDTTKRNQSMKFKPYLSSTVEIIYPEVKDFLDMLEKKRKLEFADLFKDVVSSEDDLDLIDQTIETSETHQPYIVTYGMELKDKDIFSKAELLPVIESFKRNIKKSDKANYIYTASSKRKQKTALNTLMKRAKLYQEENAIDILYLSIGFLNWYEADHSDDVISSPLCLIPIKLERGQLDAPFKLSLKEDELQTNTTLLKAFEEQFGMHLDYEFNETLDLYANYQNYQTYVKSMIHNPRWSITDEVHIGLFAFSKINMYKDIEDNEAIIANHALVMALSGDLTRFKDEGEIYQEEDLDRLIVPERYFQALDADSSQELAIQAAISGKSFVLQGPPGTGKSQTITNIISELIARGKHVLFVAEKKAALDVVYQNLNKVGLADYALPLHHTKIDKKSVVKTLHQSLLARQTIKEIDAREITALSRNYHQSHEALLAYRESLLQKRMPIHLSLYELLGKYLSYDHVLDLIFDIPNYEKIDSNQLDLIIKNIRTFGATYQTVKPLQQHPFYGLSAETMSLQEKEHFFNDITHLKTDIDELYAHVDEMLFDIDIETLSFNRLTTAIDFIRHIANLPSVDQTLIAWITKKNSATMFQSDIKAYKTIKSLIEENTAQEQALFAIYDREVMREDIKHMYRVMRASSSFFSRLFSSTYKKTKTTLKFYQRQKHTHYHDLKHDIDSMMAILIRKKEIDAALKSVHYKDASLADIEQVISTLEFYEKIHTFIHKRPITLKTTLLTYLKKAFDKKPLLTIYADKLTYQKEHISVLLEGLKKHFNPDMKPWNDLHFKKIDIAIDAMLCHKEELNDYLSFNSTYQTGLDLGLHPFYDVILNKELSQDLDVIFLKRFFLLWIDNLFQKEPVLHQFSRYTYDQYQKTYQQADKMMINFARYQIDEIMAKNAPNIEGLEGHNGELLLLRREANKSRKIKPIRLLFKEMPHLIMDLKPCLMMSPLSVSSFLKSTDYHFDAVIFDEASQVRPESAIGAIYRSKQLIVVGDKEQLPPTSFFDTIEEDEALDTDANAFDSILELAAGILKPIALKWHYRSKFEELIYVSNQFIYQDLITFPSKNAAKEREGIDFHYVADGIYHDRKNIPEAKAVATLVFKHFDRYQDRKSLGVVTFSESQQNAVERAIEKHRRKHPAYEPYFNDDRKEPFFVKNIETVQGDERDTIILSVGYGKDTKGKMRMNFGPLNRDGGYRRLNVAISRAKYNVILVSSIKDGDVDLNRTSAKGAQMLKTYLRFAEYGMDLKVDIENDDPNFDSRFEHDVYETIKTLGYHVKTQVGSSGYRIDLGVLHPELPTSYVLGIECDGATYHRSKVSRDRDRLRQEVLESRGWQIYRIWSTDWFKHKQAEITKLKQRIEKSILAFNQTVKKEHTSKDINFTETKKEIKVADFETYPNYDMLYEENKAKHIVIALEDVFKKTAPIHIEEIEKIVPPFFDRQKYTSVVDQAVEEALYPLKQRIGLIKKGDYYELSDQQVTFRKQGVDSTRRPFEHIHRDELKKGIITILEITEVIAYDQLLQELLKFSGFQKSSKIIRDIFVNIITELQAEQLIYWKDDMIELRQKTS